MPTTSPALATLPQQIRDALLSTVRPKFDAYFAFTPNCACTRSVETGQLPDRSPIYTYSDASMISDLTVLWALFCEVYESGAIDVNGFLSADPSLEFQLRRIIEDGEFWDSPHPGRRTLRQIPLAGAVTGRLPDVCRVLRNGFAHFNWRYENLSAEDYWKRNGWDTLSPQPAFNLRTRGPNNYTAYIVDAAPPWNSTAFWDMKNLRIVVTPFHILRYHLHLFLNVLLNGSAANVFTH